MVRVVRTIDAHVGGQPLRLLVEGVPRPSGRTMAQKQAWMKRHADELRRAVMLEPRGHADMCGALFTEPVAPGSNAGLLFLDGSGFPAMSGHAVIAAATVAIERQLISQRDTVDSDGGEAAGSPAEAARVRLVFDTPAGPVHTHLCVSEQDSGPRVDLVTMTNVPCFVVRGGKSVRVGAREIRIDVAFGGLFYAIVDSESIGVPLTGSRLPELRRLGVQICEAVNAAGEITHPADRMMSSLAGVVFTGPSHDPGAHLRGVTVSCDAGVDRSPSATGTSAVMAVLDAMGLLQVDEPFVQEGIAGSTLRGRLLRRTQVGDLAAIVPGIEGAAWITGEHTFLIDEDDPYRRGLIL